MSRDELSREEHELREDALGRQLGAALTRERAPEAWARAALAAPRRPAAVVAPAPVRDEPWILAILPHLCGLALLLGLVISLWMRPDLIQALADYVTAGVTRAEGEAASSALSLVAALLTPAVVLLLVEGTRGFPLVRRMIGTVR